MNIHFDAQGAVSTLQTWGIYLYNFYFLAWVYVFQQVWFVVSLVAFLFLLYVVYREEQRALARPDRSYMMELDGADEGGLTPPGRVRRQLRR